MMFQLNLTFNLFMVMPYLLIATNVMVLAWIYTCSCKWLLGVVAMSAPYFDVHVFNPHAPTNRSFHLASCYRHHENLKKINTRFVYVKLNIHPSPLSFCLPLVVWPMRLLISTNVLLQALPPNGTKLTVQACLDFATSSTIL